MNFTFRIQHGTIYLFDGDEMITGYRRLAFAVAVDDPTAIVMQKYGEEEQVQEWHSNAVKKYAAARMAHLTPRIIVFAHDNWDLHDINRFINNTGFIGSWILKNHPELLLAEPISVGN